ncbi:DUF305 domain-containing protein [Nocardiopsis coralliicola]
MLRRAFPVTAALALALSAGCSGGDGGSADPPVLQPGGPGDEATPASEEDIDAANQEITHNEADVRYVVMMIEHHRQALVMTEAVDGDLENGGLTKIAERIEAAQDPEIDAMEKWLEDNVYGPAEGNPNYADQCGLTEWRDGADGGGGGHHGGGDCPIGVSHEDMPGMASPEQLDELEDAAGADADELFVELMTAHHEGAIEMAETASTDGKHTEVLRMASDVMAEQRADINRMEEQLED